MPIPGTRKDRARSITGYFRQLALAYDQLGYTGALFATGAHDVWVLAGALLPYTERLKFLIAIHPGLVPVTLLAKMAATLQDFSRGRVMINVVSGDAKMLGAYGMDLPHDERYAMADEYLSIWHRLMAGESVTHTGKYVTVTGAKLAMPAGEAVAPPLWFGGSSALAMEVAAKHVDVYLSWGEDAGADGGQGRTGAPPGRRAGPEFDLRRPPLRHRARNRSGGLGRSPVAVRSNGRGAPSPPINASSEAPIQRASAGCQR